MKSFSYTVKWSISTGSLSTELPNVFKHKSSIVSLVCKWILLKLSNRELSSMLI